MICDAMSRCSPQLLLLLLGTSCICFATTELDSTQLNGLELDHSVTQMHSTTGLAQEFKEGPLGGAVTNSAPASKVPLESANKDSNAKSEVLSTKSEVLGEALSAKWGGRRRRRRSSSRRRSWFKSIAKAAKKAVKSVQKKARKVKGPRYAPSLSGRPSLPQPLLSRSGVYSHAHFSDSLALGFSTAVSHPICYPLALCLSALALSRGTLPANAPCPLPVRFSLSLLASRSCISRCQLTLCLQLIVRATDQRTARQWQWHSIEDEEEDASGA